VSAKLEIQSNGGIAVANQREMIEKRNGSGSVARSVLRPKRFVKKKCPVLRKWLKNSAKKKKTRRAQLVANKQKTKQ